MHSGIDSSLHVLLVEDAEFDKEIFIKALLKVNPFAKYIHCKSAGDALNFLRKTDDLPGYIFLDLGLPDMTGKECLIQIRKIERCSNIPVIILSASVRLSDEKETKEVGANYYLYKDRNFDAICDSINLIFSVNKNVTHSIS